MKRKTGSGRYERRHADRRPLPYGVLVVECTDPRCGLHPGDVTIHQLGVHTEEPAAQREEAGASHADPFADPSDCTSEGGSSEQRTATS